MLFNGKHEMIISNKENTANLIVIETFEYFFYIFAAIDFDLIHICQDELNLYCLSSIKVPEFYSSMKEGCLRALSLNKGCASSNSVRRKTYEIFK